VTFPRWSPCADDGDMNSIWSVKTTLTHDQRFSVNQ